MTIIRTLSDQDPLINCADLPPPDKASELISSAANASPTLSKPIPAVNDTGRIIFGASCRIPVRN